MGKMRKTEEVGRDRQEKSFLRAGRSREEGVLLFSGV